jgi:hypothetical protein
LLDLSRRTYVLVYSATFLNAYALWEGIRKLYTKYVRCSLGTRRCSAGATFPFDEPDAEGI